MTFIDIGNHHPFFVITVPSKGVFMYTKKEMYPIYTLFLQSLFLNYKRRVALVL